MFRDGNLRIPSPTTGTRISEPQHCRSQPIPSDHRVYSDLTFNTPFNARDTQFKVKMTRLLPLNTIAAEAPMTAKKGEYSGLVEDILLALQDTKTKDRKGGRLQSRRLKCLSRSILG